MALPNKLKLSNTVMKKLIQRMGLPASNGTVINKQTVCLEWVGRYDEYERPVFRLNGQYKLAKHVIYESWYEPIEPNMTIINYCRNKNCVRPDHLKLSYYFFQTTYARNGKKDPNNRRKKLIVKITEKLMLRAFNGIKNGKYKTISDVGRFLNVSDADTIDYLSNDNWMYINDIYSKSDLDDLREKVMLNATKENNSSYTLRSFIDGFIAKHWV